MIIILDGKEYELMKTVDSFGDQTLLLWFDGKIIAKEFNHEGDHVVPLEWAERNKNGQEEYVSFREIIKKGE